MAQNTWKVTVLTTFYEGGLTATYNRKLC